MTADSPGLMVRGGPLGLFACDCELPVHARGISRCGYPVPEGALVVEGLGAVVAANARRRIDRDEVLP